jgi:CBS domain containing-hemolysin-like protein
MTPLLLFLLACSAVFVGTATAAFGSLMRLSLRIMAEGSGRDDRLGKYLDDPRRLFVPAHLVLGTIAVLATALLARVTGIDPAGLPVLLVSAIGFTLVTEHLIPLLIVRRDPERVLDAVLPAFDVVARVLTPLTAALLTVGTRYDRAPAAAAPAEPQKVDVPPPPGTPEPLQEGQARALLRTIVDFRETMVREVMTPRPDIVGIDADATIERLQTLFREQQYSRVPVFKDTLDNVVGFAFVKDLIQLKPGTNPGQSIAALVRPAHFVPETKRVFELLQEFQRNRLQIAVVVDEYGGTAGLVTLEDLLEEIVGEIRDEYDVEVEPVVDEGQGTFVFSGKAHVQELADRLNVDVEGGAFETVGGFLLSQLGRVPAAGERFDVDGLQVEVIEAERRRITRVRMRRPEPVPSERAAAVR